MSLRDGVRTGWLDSLLGIGVEAFVEEVLGRNGPPSGWEGFGYSRRSARLVRR